MNHIFGPVLSRRLGLSLGIDVVPYKVCTYDCIYCQLGRTTTKTIKRKSFFSTNKILKEIEKSLKSRSDINYVTFSGSGEPLLNKDIRLLIEKTKEMTDIPVAVLTNGSLIFNEEVQFDILDADLVMPSLDAGDESLFQYINRPHKLLRFDKINEGLINFRKTYKGQIWLEVFLCSGVNTTIEEVLKIKRLCNEIKPDKIQLNTAKRPTAEDFVFAVDSDNLNKIKKIFGKNTEIIGEGLGYAVKDKSNIESYVENKTKVLSDICSLLSRRPCTLEDISGSLNIKVAEISKLMPFLEGKIESKFTSGSNYYYIREKSEKNG